jgi:hypothetical protein
MRYLRAHHTVISLTELASAITTQKPLPPNACVITFDDSYADHYRYAYPILKQLGLVATFFVESGHVANAGRIRCLDRYYYLLDHSPVKSFSVELSNGARLDSHPLNPLAKLTLLQNFGLKQWLKQSDPSTQEETLTALESALQANLQPTQLSRELYLSVEEMTKMVEGGMELGAHTVHHPSLLHVDIETARTEIFESGDFVKQICQLDAIAFAYPFGEASNSPAISHLVRKYGYCAACTTAPGLNTLATNPLALKRVELTEASL